MSLQTRINALALAIGADVKALRLANGDLASLSTTAKTNLVAAINEIVLAQGASSSINDSAGDGALAATWSANKIFDSIEAAKAEVKSDLLGGAGTAFDTLNELAEALGQNPTFATTIATELGNRVRWDSAMTLTAPQKAQARTNIGGASEADLTALSDSIGDPETNIVAAYTAAAEVDSPQ